MVVGQQQAAAGVYRRLGSWRQGKFERAISPQSVLTRITPSVAWEAVDRATVVIMAIFKAAACKDEEETCLERHT